MNDTHPLSGLEPASLWGWFARICAVPHGSKQEDALMADLVAQAELRGWGVKRDHVGNLVVLVPATPGFESVPTLVMQGHADMVCEKNRETVHNFETDPIRCMVEDGWVTAEGTTLGADNGIGVAAALSLAEDPACDHGPLEILITIDEETGLTGANALEASLLTGRTLLNLDSEEEGTLYVGCAGGLDTEIVLPMPRVAGAEALGVVVCVRGLKGGHSGLNIHEGRGNALQFAGRLLEAATERCGARLHRLEGGSKRNAIPREAEVYLTIPADQKDALRALCASLADTFRAGLPAFDRDLDIRVARADVPDDPFAASAVAALVGLLAETPHGVIAMSKDLPGLVETSTNLGVARTEGASVRLITSQRSSVDADRLALGQAVRDTATRWGATAESNNGYPGWDPKLSSPILGRAQAVWERLTGKTPHVTAIHAGLECGIIGERFPEMDMVSFGPDITGAHSPDERVNIGSVGRFYEYARALVSDYTRAHA